MAGTRQRKTRRTDWSNKVSLTVIVPTHRRPASLERLLDALEGQIRARQNRSIIVVNDGSDDRAYDKVIERFAGLVDYVVMPENKGPAAARNVGAERATGDYFVFADDDCVPPADWLDRLAQILRERPETDVVGGAVQPVPNRRRGVIERYLIASEFLTGPRFNKGRLVCIPTANLAVRQDWFDKVGGFDERFRYPGSEDIVLTIALKHAGARIHLDPSWFVWHQHDVGLASHCRRFYRYGYGHVQLRSFGRSPELQHFIDGLQKDASILHSASRAVAFARSLDFVPERPSLDRHFYKAIAVAEHLSYRRGGERAFRDETGDEPLAKPDGVKPKSEPRPRSGGGRSLRIAQVAPLSESVPPMLTGGVNRVISHLTEELVGLGHEVTLFASGDSVTEARLIAGCPRALRWDFGRIDKEAPFNEMVKRVYAEAGKFDVIHLHWSGFDIPLRARHRGRTLMTMHWRMDRPKEAVFFRRVGKSGIPVVALSNAQRAPQPGLDWRGTVANGLPENLFEFYDFEPWPRDYLVYLGRLSRAKRPDRAVRIAQLAGLKLKIAGPSDAHDREYYEQVVAPMFNDPLVEFVGEVDDLGKQEFLGGARALIVPIDWPEPFGLVMIEAMACGTPVIAFRHGAVPEIVEDGVTGYVVDDVIEAAQAVDRVSSLDRARIRRRFEDRFSASRVTREYVAIYEAMLKDGA